MTTQQSSGELCFLDLGIWDETVVDLELGRRGWVVYLGPRHQVQRWVVLRCIQGCERKDQLPLPDQLCGRVDLVSNIVAHILMVGNGSRYEYHSQPHHPPAA